MEEEGAHARAPAAARSSNKQRVDPRLSGYYRDKLAKAKVALTGLQLMERAQKMGLLRKKNKASVRKAVYKFLREEATTRGPSFARRDKVKHYQGTVAFKPGVYFVDYGEYRKDWRKQNGGATGFLVAVENLTNRLFVLPTRGKDTRQWLRSLSEFVEKTRQVSVIYSDRDSVASKAFRARVQSRYGIRWYFLKKGHKSYLAERYIGFVKTKLSQALESDSALAKNKKWIDLVEPLVREYNTQLIPGTRYRRQAISKENYSDFLAQLFKSPDYDLQISGRIIQPFDNERWNRAVFAFDLGDKVRVSRKADWTDPENRAGFKKVSTVGSYGSKIYTVSGRQLRTTKQGTRFVPVYKLKEIRDGGFNFYENELVRASSTQSTEAIVSPSSAAQEQSKDHPVSQ